MKSLLFLTLVSTSCTLLASAIDVRGAEYRRQRINEVARNDERISNSKSNLRHADNRDDQSTTKSTSTSTSTRHRRRTRGTSSGNRQNRRELGKSTSSSGKSSSGKSSSSSSSGTSGSSGSRSGSGEGFSSDDGSYCGCLCFPDETLSGVYNYGVSCDYTVDASSYGFGLSNQQPDNSGSYLSSYFQYNRMTSWAVVEDPTDDFFTEFGYQNQNWETYEGRNDNGDDAAAQEAYYTDDAAEAEADEEADGIVVVDQMDSGYNPYEAFDIGTCDTYAHLWTYDLFESCAGGTGLCECSYTEELMAMGLLSCADVSSCPAECGVCANCIHSVCDKYAPSMIVASGMHGNVGLAATAIFSTILIAAYAAFKRCEGGSSSSKKSGRLGESFLDGDDATEKTSYTAKNMSVPLDSDGLPTTSEPPTTQQKGFFNRNRKSNVDSKPVWLVPDISTIPTKPLFPDLLKKDSIDDEEEFQRQHQRNPQFQRQHQVPTSMIVAPSNASVPSTISFDSNSDGEDDSSSSDSNTDRDSVDKTRPDGKSIGTKEGEI